MVSTWFVRLVLDVNLTIPIVLGLWYFLEDWKIKIAVLWLFYVGAFLTVMALGTMEPGALAEFLETEAFLGNSLQVHQGYRYYSEQQKNP